MRHAVFRTLAILAVVLPGACRTVTPAGPPVRGFGATPEEALASELRWTYQAEAFVQATRLEGGGVDTRGGSVHDEHDIELGHGSLVDPTGGLRLEARHADGWGLTLEASYFDAGDDQDSRVGFSEPRIRHSQIDLLYTRRLRAREVDFFVGVRGWSAHATWTARTFGIPGDDGSRSGEEQWIDPVLGFRWSRPLRGRWSSMGRVDVGGFGIGSDLSWTLELGARYALDDRWSLSAQYKFQGIDFPRDEGSSSSIGYDTILHGPRFGVAFGF